MVSGLICPFTKGILIFDEPVIIHQEISRQNRAIDQKHEREEMSSTPNAVRLRVFMVGTIET